MGKMKETWPLPYVGQLMEHMLERENETIAIANGFRYVPQEIEAIESEDR